jgi:hypothetical protein
MRTPTSSSRQVLSLRRVLRFAGAVALAVACLWPTVASAQSATRFVGNWVEDQSKRTIGSMRNLTFRLTAGGGLEELRGSSARPLLLLVRFDGKPYEGEGSPNTFTWKQLDATHFERTVSKDSQLLNTRRLQISADGTTLTEATDTTDDGKKVVTTIVYRRTSGSGAGLTGVWKPQSYKSDTPNTLRLEAVGRGLRGFTNERSTSRTAFTLAFDGKASPVEGPNTISGSASAGTLVDDRSIDIAQSREGVPTGRQTWVLTPDGKTLTTSSTFVGPDATGAASLVVYTRK